MEAADGDCHAALAKLAANVERPRKLIRLNADQRDESAVGQNALGNARDVDDRVALVVGFDLDVGVGSEGALFGAFRQQSMDAGQAVRGNGRPPPLDDVAVIVVMRRLDQNDREPALGHEPAFRSVRLSSLAARVRKRQRRLPARARARRWGAPRCRPSPSSLALARRKFNLNSRARDVGVLTN